VAALGLLTVAIGGAYVVAQQLGRRSADDAPRAVAQQWAERMTQGGSRDLVKSRTVELTSAAAPFVIVFDSTHRVLDSTVAVGGQTPSVPPGVLDVAASSGSNQVTWQPAAVEQ